jgi:hypothetical protein
LFNLLFFLRIIRIFVGAASKKQRIPDGPVAFHRKRSVEFNGIIKPFRILTAGVQQDRIDTAIALPRTE